ncbi:MAG: hypothetical protein KIT09_28520 [Bryobacteraceae bacterium]|nr:hypothetical protein [Bryobacteraceae bacterium]
MVSLNDIRPLRDFKRSTSEVLHDLHKKGATRGADAERTRAGCGVQEAAYQKLLDYLEELERELGRKRTSRAAGKTTMALQFLLAGRAAGETGLFVTLSESERELRETCESHGWSLPPAGPGPEAVLRTPQLYDAAH